MSQNKKKIPLYSVLEEDENIYREGKPNSFAYVLNACKEDIPKFILDVLFKCIFVPSLFFKCRPFLSQIPQILIIVIWFIYLLPTLKMLAVPFVKFKEQKNTYYIITDKAIYVQYGTDTIYYRKYPKERIGTKVFYRQNKVDNFCGVGTLGFSVDDYYEERLLSIKNYEDIYRTLQNIANEKRRIAEQEYREREERKLEIAEQAKLLAQEEFFMKHQEEEEERLMREEHERRMELEARRQREEHEKFMREREMRLREEERRRNVYLSKLDDDDDDDDFEDDDDDDDNDEINDVDMGDMYGAQIEGREPSEKVKASYRNRYGTPSSAAHRRNAGKRTERNEIKFEPDGEAEAPKENKFDMNKLWNNNQDN